MTMLRSFANASSVALLLLLLAVAVPPLAEAAPVVVQSATLSPLRQFDPDTEGLSASRLQLGADGNYYSVISRDSPPSHILYRINASGDYAVVHTFTTDEGQVKGARFARGPDGSLYGITSGTVVYTSDSSYTTGAVIFRIDRQGNYSAVYTFEQIPLPDTDGNCDAMLVVGADGTLYGARGCGGADGTTATVFKIDTQGQFTLLYSFSTLEAFAKPTSVALAADGTLFGVTRSGGGAGAGTLFKVATDGTFSVIYAFTEATGYYTPTTLLAGPDGLVYGWVFGEYPGFNLDGSLFRVTSDGQITILYEARKITDVILGDDGNFYAATSDGTVDSIVRITPQGDATTLHTFDIPSRQAKCLGRCVFGPTLYNFDGFSIQEYAVRLTQGGDGNLYGVTYVGGAEGAGTVFSLAPDGSTFTLLFTFNPLINNPAFPLVQDGQGNLLGIASHTLFKLEPNGPISVTASVTPSSAAAGESVTLDWTSTGATACYLSSRIPGLVGQYPLPATSGSMTVTPQPYSIGATYRENPDAWIFNVQCAAADGSQAGYAARLPRL